MKQTLRREYKLRSGMALGGIGAGWFELRADGCCHAWNLFNNRPLGRGPHFQDPAHSVLFFLVRIEEPARRPRLWLLQLEESHGAALIEWHEHQYIFPWLSGVDEIRTETEFPFQTMTFRAQDMPVEVELRAWSPFIPHDVKNSSLPTVCFDFVVRSHAAGPVRVSVVASLRNCVGYDVEAKHFTSRLVRGGKNGDFLGFEHGAAEIAADRSSAGTMGLFTTATDATYALGWGHLHPYYESLLRSPALPDTDDTAARNKRDAQGRPANTGFSASSLCRTALLEPGAAFDAAFVFAWHFPNHYARSRTDLDFTPRGYLEAAASPEPAADGTQDDRPHVEGHYYSNFFRDAEEVAAYVVSARASLHRESRQFLETFTDSTADPTVIRQVLCQLNTFRTSAWLTRAGDFGVLEGLGQTQSYAGLGTMDVAMYGSVMTAALFPELDRAFLRAHMRFKNPDGSIIHSIAQDFRRVDVREAAAVRLDLPAQFVCQALRHAAWTDDTAFLREVWPHVTAALDYVLRERDPDGDGVPEMEGVMCSYDNFPMYGTAPYLLTQWLAALRAAGKAARQLGDKIAAQHFARLSWAGGQRLEEQCWNGRYYRLSSRGGPGGTPDEGCLSDQLLGVWAGWLTGNGDLLPMDRKRSALREILSRNFVPEQGLRNCQWPGDEERGFHPVAADCWVDQANTCWTGVEYAVAALLIYEGMEADALRLLSQVEGRHRRWGTEWDHQEFGGHYYRPMSAWSLVHAVLGLEVAGGHWTFHPRGVASEETCLFFPTPDGYGQFIRRHRQTEVRVVRGSWHCRTLALGGGGPVGSVSVQPAEGTEEIICERRKDAHDREIIVFPDGVRVLAGQRLVLATAA